MSKEKKGNPAFVVGNALGGRTKGSMNRVTKFSREVLTMALAGQEKNIMFALEELAEKNPEAYINAVSKLLNYAIPKLQSTEVNSKSASKIEITLDDTMTVDDLKRRMEEMEADETDYEEIDE
jgi:hypothetical protein|tara:strand:- start:119 stop:487 length:369 start_codon:yes stop_codon:yes gene_type:complete